MRSAAYLTTSWDDGHPLDLRLAERLAFHGIPATFYIPARYERPVLDAARIRELAAHFDVGAHTMTHPNLRTVSVERATEEISASRRFIEDTTGRRCRMFAPPGGKFRGRHLRLVRDAGFAGMRTVELMSVRHPEAREGLFVLPTTLQVFALLPGAHLRNAVRRFRLGNWITFLTLARGQGLERAAAALADRAAAGGVFHLWGHSWEIEEAGLWPTLENVLSLLRSRAGEFQFVTNSDLCGQGAYHEHFA